MSRNSVLSVHLSVPVDASAGKEIVRVVVPISLPILDVRPYARIDIGSTYRIDGGPNHRFHVGHGKFFASPWREPMSIEAASRLLAWEEEPEAGVDGHPFAKLYMSEYIGLTRIGDMLKPPDWTVRSRWRDKPSVPHAARAEIYGGGPLVQYQDVAPARLVRPRMLRADEVMPASAFDAMAVLQKVVEAEMGVVDGELVMRTPEPLLFVSATGKRNGLVRIMAAFDGHRTEPPFGAAYPLTEAASARRAVARLARRFDGRIGPEPSMSLARGSTSSFDSRLDLWLHAAKRLPSAALEVAMLLDDDAVRGAVGMMTAWADHAVASKRDAGIDVAPFIDRWMQAWERFQRAFGNWQADFGRHGNAFKRLYVTNEFVRCCLSNDQRIRGKGVERAKRDDRVEELAFLTSPFLTHGGSAFMEAWLTFRASTDEEIATTAISAMLQGDAQPRQFAHDAARKRWNAISESLRVFAGLPEPVPHRPDDSFGDLIRTIRHRTMETPPEPMAGVDALDEHARSEIQRLMLHALEAGWTWDQVKQAFEKAVDHCSSEERE